MKKNSFITSLSAAICLSGVCMTGHADAQVKDRPLRQAQDRPNVLMIVCDDLNEHKKNEGKTI